MARNVTGRVILEGTLTAETPLHVGAHGEDVDTDLPLARNGAGMYYIPGTSLAGVLRAWSRQALDDQFERQLWGFQEGEQGHASFVLVEDARITRQPEVEIRDGVGIDRRWGCAAEHIKYDRAVLPAGTMMSLRLVVEYQEGGKDRALGLVDALHNALSQAELVLGAGTTRGLGRVRLQGARLTVQQFHSRQGILAVVRNPEQGEQPKPEELERARQAVVPQRRRTLVAIVHWQPHGPLMVKAGMEGVASDMLPLLSRRGRELYLVLPGSSVKGALRYRAECIMRTLLKQDVSHEKDSKQPFLADVRVPLVDEAFGVRGLSTEERAADPAWRRRLLDTRESVPAYQPPLPGRGALSVADCYATSGIKAEAWDSIVQAKDDAALCQALQGAGLKWQQAYHVAVDRWTGGAAESFLYTVLEPHAVKWEPLRIELDLGRLAKDLENPAIMLLLLLLRDMADRRLPLGFGTNRGLGAVKVKAVEFHASGMDGDDVVLQALDGQRCAGGNIRTLSGSLAQQLDEAWEACLKALRSNGHG